MSHLSTRLLQIFSLFISSASRESFCALMPISFRNRKRWPKLTWAHISPMTETMGSPTQVTQWSVRLLPTFCRPAFCHEGNI
ncbi:hypothetical protein BDQ17DRAFT_1380230 [Cyathus striatus]|nr:hypothetical protein BDQ17DRAFT_1380230 [Cyathus striatus]